ncbi:MAG: hypothetical protein K1Y36_12455 [Blastocatellia bacterium]|nr:hypothetical protein [Blastocatellia bacterium]
MLTTCQRWETTPWDYSSCRFVNFHPDGTGKIVFAYGQTVYADIKFRFELPESGLLRLTFLHSPRIYPWSEDFVPTDLNRTKTTQFTLIEQEEHFPMNIVRHTKHVTHYIKFETSPYPEGLAFPYETPLTFYGYLTENMLSERHLPIDFRVGLRRFASGVASCSLQPVPDGYNLFQEMAKKVEYAMAHGVVPPDGHIYNYTPWLVKKDDTIGRIFAVFLNHWKPTSIEEWDNQFPYTTPDYRAGQWLKAYCIPEYQPHPPLKAWEAEIHDGRDWKAVIQQFALLFGTGTLEPDILRNLNYVERLVDEPSRLEIVFAVLGNVLEIDLEGKVTNQEWAFRRAAEMAKTWCLSGYEPAQPFADWETELL